MTGPVTKSGRTMGCLVWLMAPWLAMGAGCAAGQRCLDAPCTASDEAQHSFREDAEEPTSISGWEARQMAHTEALAMAAGRALRIPPQDADDPASQRPPRASEPHHGVGEHPGAQPVQVRPSQPSPAREPPPVAGPVMESQTYRRRPRRVRRASCRSCGTARHQGSLRCQRICRHTGAICLAASKICLLARQLGDQPALEACRRAEARCEDARSIAKQTCPPCQGN